MPDRARLTTARRRAATFIAGFLFAGGLYLLLIDTLDLPELIVGVAAVLLAVLGLELAREQGLVREGLRAGWLRHALRPAGSVPRDVVLLSVAAVRAVIRPREEGGAFRVVRWCSENGEALGRGKMALAESLGSFAPNTIIVGIDADRELLLAHQLVRRGGREAVDPLELG